MRVACEVAESARTRAVIRAKFEPIHAAGTATHRLALQTLWRGSAKRHVRRLGLSVPRSPGPPALDGVPTPGLI